MNGFGEDDAMPAEPRTRSKKRSDTSWQPAIFTCSLIRVPEFYSVKVKVGDRDRGVFYEYRW